MAKPRRSAVGSADAGLYANAKRRIFFPLIVSEPSDHHPRVASIHIASVRSGGGCRHRLSNHSGHRLLPPLRSKPSYRPPSCSSGPGKRREWIRHPITKLLQKLGEPAIGSGVFEGCLINLLVAPRPRPMERRQNPPSGPLTELAGIASTASPIRMNQAVTRRKWG
jgi:hypothetical protein